MTAGVAGLLQALQRCLRDELRPELTSDHALAQLAGALDILAKLEALVDWSPALVDAQARPLLEALAKVQAAVRAAGLQLQCAATDGEDPEGRVRKLIDLAFDPSTPWPAGLRAQVHEVLQAALRESVSAQRRLIPKTDFSSMTSTRD